MALAALGGGLYLTLRRADAVPAVPTPPRIVRLREHHWTVPRSMRQEYFQDPQRLNRDFRLRPVEGDNAGDVRSLVVDFVGETSPMHAAGFRRGDRILEVNGEPVRTMSRALSLVEEVQGRDVLTVRVDREGMVRTVRCDFSPSGP